MINNTRYERVFMGTMNSCANCFDHHTGVLHGKPAIENENLQGFDYIRWKEMHDGIYSSIAENVKGATLAEKIFSVMGNHRVHAGKSEFINDEPHRTAFLNKIQKAIDEGRPIDILLPAYPFKFPNPLKAETHRADIAEVESMTHLNGICEAINQIYEHGAKILIASDGLLYSKLFGIPDEHALQYKQDLRNITDNLSISTIKFSDIIQDLKPQVDSQWEESYKINYSHICKNWHILKNQPAVAELARNSKRNMNLEPHANNIFPKHGTGAPPSAFDDFFNIVFVDGKHNNHQTRIEVDRAVEEFTKKYLAINYVLTELKVFDSFYPDHLRTTSHPKPGQIGLHLMNKKSADVPWGGCGVIRCDSSNRKGYVTSRFWYNIVRQPERYTALSFSDNKLGYKELKK